MKVLTSINNRLGFSIVATLLFGLFLVFILNSQTTSSTPNLEKPELLEEALENYSEVYTRSGELPNAMFSELPLYPKHLPQIRTMVAYQYITDLCSIAPEYYTQPEFYPIYQQTWIEILKTKVRADELLKKNQTLGLTSEEEIEASNNSQYGRWGAWGYGSYPSQSLNEIPPNKPFTIIMCFWVRSSALVETYQGIYLNVLFPKTATLQKMEFKDLTKTVENPSNVQELLRIYVTPNLFIIGPSYPVFSNGKYTWVQPIKLIIESNGLPLGRYAVSIDATSPSSTFNENARLKLLGNIYVEGGKTSVGPLYTAFIDTT